jgi:diguanylate cyclase (GGDEF)-like protein
MGGARCLLQLDKVVTESSMLSTDTIFLIAVLQCVVMLFVLSSMWRAAIPGVREWVGGNLCALLAFVLYAFGKALPPWLAYEAANGAYAASTAFMLAGYHRFLGWRVPVAPLATAVGLLIAAVALFNYVFPSFALRTAAVSVYQSTISIAIILLTLRVRRTKRFRYPYFFTGVMAALAAVGQIARGILYLAYPDQFTSLLQPAGLNLFFLSAGALMLPVLTLGAVMMVHDSMLAGAEHAANRDFLTNAWSRRAFFEIAERELSQARRSGRALSLLLIDVDHFKAINDTLGHAAGDRVLIDLVTRAAAVIRDIDFFARIGGEEFAVMLPDTDRQQAYMVAERLRLSLANPQTIPGMKNAIDPYTVSVGLAAYRPDESFREFMMRADAALYEAKAAGRNTVMGDDALVRA